MQQSGQDCDVYVHGSLFKNTLLHGCMCVGRHLDEQGMHLHLETRTPTPHVQTQTVCNSSPLVVGMKMGLVSVNQAGHALPALSCDHLAAQSFLQVLTFFGQAIHNQVSTGS